MQELNERSEALVASRIDPDFRPAIGIAEARKNALAGLPALRYGLAREAFIGPPRGIASPFPDNPYVRRAEPHWSWQGRKNTRRPDLVAEALRLLSCSDMPAKVGSSVGFKMALCHRDSLNPTRCYILRS